LYRALAIPFGVLAHTSISLPVHTETAP